MLPSVTLRISNLETKLRIIALNFFAGLLPVLAMYTFRWKSYENSSMFIHWFVPCWGKGKKQFEFSTIQWFFLSFKRHEIHELLDTWAPLLFVKSEAMYQQRTWSWIECELVLNAWIQIWSSEILKTGNVFNAKECLVLDYRFEVDKLCADTRAFHQYH